MADTDIQRYTAEEWDFLRERFGDSALNATEIAKLGQNVGISWPFRGKDETPDKYIGYSFEELKEVPGFIGKKSRIKLLMDILRETLAFDDPFGDMVSAVETESETDDTLLKALEKFGIPGDYPAGYLAFSEATLEFLKNEGVSTLSQCLKYGKEPPALEPVAAELKAFLNSMVHKDEKVMAGFMPYRRGESGFHLAEAIGLICENLDPATRLHLLQVGGFALSGDEQQVLNNTSRLTIDAGVKSALEKLEKVAAWFKPEAPGLEGIISSGGSPERFFLVINDARRERMAVALAKIHIACSEAKRSSFFSRIFGR